MLQFISQDWAAVEQTTKAAPPARDGAAPRASGGVSTRRGAYIAFAVVESLAPSVRTLIQRARLRRHWTTDELGERVGVPEAQIRAFEDGSVFPMADVLSRLQTVLRVCLVPINPASDEARGDDVGRPPVS